MVQRETEMKDWALEVKNVSKFYPQTSNHSSTNGNWKRLFRLLTTSPKNEEPENLFHALSDVSLKLRKGESLGIIGLNGSGKSTLLQIISGTLEATLGTVRTSGRIAALLELGSGFNPDFTGKENIYLNATILGLSQSEIDTKYDDIVAFADIGEFIDQPIRTYSSGMSLRLAFAIIAHIEPDILIIDEALAVGDTLFVQKCMRFLRNFQEVGSLVLVSHDIGAVQSLCDRCIWLHHGQIKGEGNTKEISEAYLSMVLCGGQDSGVSLTSKSGEARVEEPPPKDQEEFLFSWNEGEAFTFQPNAASFGEGNATIRQVELLEDETGKSLDFLCGQQKVTLIIRVEAAIDFTKPIIGFIVRDRFGQNLFSNNTYSNYKDNSIHVLEGETLIAEFSFHMPILPKGDYSLTVAIAEGDETKHRQHHWIHDAMILKSLNETSTGLVGIPMNRVSLNVE